jgi:hypothetical protein
MRFALLGDHPDGLEMARAVAASDRHALAVYSGSPVGTEYLRRWEILPRLVGDLEEVLADPAVEAVIVAGSPADRPAQLRRALQSERPALCVHPADQSPDLGYEAAMLQADAQVTALPLLPDALHPALVRLRELLHDESPLPAAASDTTRRSPIRLIELRWCSPDPILLETETEGHKPGLPCWSVLRALGGEIAEVSAFAETNEAPAAEPMLVTGRFLEGGLFQVVLVPHYPESQWELNLITAGRQFTLGFPLGWPGPARLTWNDERGERHEESWDAWNPWPALLEVFEQVVEAQPRKARVRTAPGIADVRRPVRLDAAVSEAITAAPTALAEAGAGQAGDGADTGPGPVSWEDEIRCLELDDAARRSVERRRTSMLEYQEAVEEATFKGTMALAGCGMLWICLLLFIFSVWVPWLGWLVVPALVLFLAMQVLRWVVPPTTAEPQDKPGTGPPS